LRKGIVYWKQVAPSQRELTNLKQDYPVTELQKLLPESAMAKLTVSGYLHNFKENNRYSYPRILFPNVVLVLLSF
jgi:hypothetical protein